MQPSKSENPGKKGLIAADRLKARPRRFAYKRILIVLPANSTVKDAGWIISDLIRYLCE